MHPLEIILLDGGAFPHASMDVALSRGENVKIAFTGRRICDVGITLCSASFGESCIAVATPGSTNWTRSEALSKYIYLVMERLALFHCSYLAKIILAALYPRIPECTASGYIGVVSQDMMVDVACKLHGCILCGSFCCECTAVALHDNCFDLRTFLHAALIDMIVSPFVDPWRFIGCGVFLARLALHQCTLFFLWSFNEEKAQIFFRLNGRPAQDVKVETASGKYFCAIAEIAKRDSVFETCSDAPSRQQPCSLLRHCAVAVSTVFPPQHNDAVPPPIRLAADFTSRFVPADEIVLVRKLFLFFLGRHVRACSDAQNISILD